MAQDFSRGMEREASFSAMETRPAVRPGGGQGHLQQLAARVVDVRQVSILTGTQRLRKHNRAPVLRCVAPERRTMNSARERFRRCDGVHSA